MEYVTLEDICKASGYAENTIKMLIVDGILPQSCGRRLKKGIYPADAIERIDMYKELIASGVKKSDIVRKMTR